MDEEVYILIVDDSETNLSVVSNYLRKKKYKIALATDGEGALNILEKNKIDLVLLDIMMPGMDGFEVCHKIKGNEKTRDIPVIFLTALNETDDIVKGFEIGGIDYITKPFHEAELLARVNTHVHLKLVRDTLKKNEQVMRESRDYFIQTLYKLGKALGYEK